MNISEKYSRCLTWFMALLLTALAAGCGGGGGRDAILGADVSALPAVTLTVPAAGATGVAVSTRITATFNKSMAPATITSTSFTLTGPGASAVPGIVSYAVDTKTATFTPATASGVLLANTTYTATITTGAKDLAGNAMAANYVWTFTTAADTTPPTVTLVNPVDLATGVCLQKIVNATFSEAMNPATLNSSPAGTLPTFTLKQTIAGTDTPGVVAYDAATRVATFKATSDLLANTGYTATITTAAKDLAGNGLAANKVWSFTTGTTACPTTPAIALGTASSFGNLGGTAGTTNTGTLTVIGGNLGSTATTTSAVTGFHDTAGDIYTETGSNIGAVNGKIYTCTVSTLGPTSAAVNAASCSTATQARSDAQTAYNSLTPASLPGGTDPGAGQLGGLTLAPGIYQAAGGSFQITGSDLTLDAQGDATAVWVFQTASTLTVGAPAAPRSVNLINGALAKNVFWQVGTSATINGAGGGTMVGTIIASSAVSLSTVGNAQVVTLNGRAIGLNASVTMTNTVINVPAP